MQNAIHAENIQISELNHRIPLHPPSRLRLVMAVVVVDRRRIVFGVFAGEAPGIGRSGHAAGDSQRTERRVLVVRSNIVVGSDDFGNVLVAIVGIEES